MKAIGSRKKEILTAWVCAEKDYERPEITEIFYRESSSYTS